MKNLFDTLYPDAETEEVQSLTARLKQQKKEAMAFDVTPMDPVIQTIRTEDEFELKNGRFQTIHNGQAFECFFRYNTEYTDCLWVLLSATRPEGSPKPFFNRWKYMPYVRGHILLIADPMVDLYENLLTGWYYGNKEHCLAEDICEFVPIFAKKLGIPNDRIFFFGSSAGGYTSLYCGTGVKGSTAVAINPQIQLQLYWPGKVKELEQRVGVSLNDSDPFLRNDMLQRIVNTPESRYLIIDNPFSPRDVLQLTALENKFNVKIGYGIQKHRENLITWLYWVEGERAHSIQDWSTMFPAIEHLARKFELNEETEYLYRIFNEIWHDYQTSKEKSNALNTQIKDMQNASAKCADTLSTLEAQIKELQDAAEKK